MAQRSLHAKFRSNLGLKKVNQKPQHRKKFRFTEHRSVKNTNIAHRRVWDHRSTASWYFIHRITALKEHQYRNPANPDVPFIKLYSQIVPLKSRTKCVDFTCRLLDEFADPDLHVRPPVSTIEQNSIYLLLFKYSNSQHHDVSSRMCFKYLSVC